MRYGEAVLHIGKIAPCGGSRDGVRIQVCHRNAFRGRPTNFATPVIVDD